MAFSFMQDLYAGIQLVYDGHLQLQTVSLHTVLKVHAKSGTSIIPDGPRLAMLSLASFPPGMM